MFCTNCGTQIPDESKFCTNCGAATVPIAAAPAYPEPVYEAPVYEEPVYQEPVQQEPVYQEPVYQEPVQQEPVYQEAVPQAPVYEAPVYEEPVYYADPAPAAPPVKKKKKTGLIIFIVVLVLLLAAGGVLGFLYVQDQNNKTAIYDEAVAMLEAKDYDGALAKFRELEDFKDAAKQAEDLSNKQADYDAALKLVEEHKFDEAISAFKKLKDYRDSAEYTQSKVTYLKGIYYKDSAAAGDMDAWMLLKGYSADGDMPAVEEYAVAIDLYNAAIEIFTGLADYADSADLVSECWLNKALIEMENGHYDAALNMASNMNEEDAAALEAAYAELTVDDEVLAGVEEALLVWYDDAEAYSLEAETAAAIQILEGFRGGVFASSDLQYTYEQLLYTLNNVYLQLEDDDVLDVLKYYEAMIQYLDVTATLCEDYGVFAGNSDMYTYFTMKQWDYVAYYSIEDSLQTWYDSVTTIDHDDDLGYYVTYYNNTNYDIVLHIVFTFKDSSYNILGYSEVFTFNVASGEEVVIPTGETPSGVAWLVWEWSFDLAG